MMQTIQRALALALLVLSLAGCVSSSQSIRSGTTTAVTTTTELGVPDTTADSGAYTGASEYRLGAQDLIEIAVFQVEDLNRTVRINSSGQISLPLVGTILAGGKTVSELEEEIAAELSAEFLQDPQVSVFVKEFTSQRITMEGAIKSPGIYPMRGRTTLIQAIAQAGGVTDLANLQGVVVFRKVNGEKMAAIFDLQAIRGGNAEDPEVYGDDIVVIDQSGSRTALRRFIETFPVLSFFRPY
jgi:polysaccharide export outer membrane protein